LALALVLVLLLGAVPACTREPSRPEDLLGREFEVTDVSRPEGPLREDQPAVLGFVEEGTSGLRLSACNLMEASLDITDQTLEIQIGSTTEVDCSYSDDEWLMSFLESRPEWELTGSRLVLSKGESRMVLEERTGDAESKRL
jgi:heat shock protein HslJ